ncbi:MAG: DeoR/GlpR transcriptional regulator [Ruminococcaceae bacterium]|nr:DeoR/GlpR transcriptional regulator [Oscillospiraceae bacterium]
MMTDRRSQMRAFIDERLNVRVKELQEQFPGVSVMTIRRDLAALEEEGAIIRTRGGARVNLDNLGVAEDAYRRRELAFPEAKEVISQKALAFFEPKRSIFLDAGTTMMTLARRIPDDDLVLFTAAPNIALEVLTRTRRPQVTLLGGSLSRTTLAGSGRATLEQLRSINIDMAFLSTSAYSVSGGFTVGNPYEAEMKADVIRKARRVVMLMTADKVGHSMPYTFAQMRDVDVLICEADPGEEITRLAAECGVTVL